MINHSLLVALGGLFGAISRYGITAWMKKRWPAAFPYGTLFVNVTGSFLLGVLYGGDNQPLILLFGIGFMGAYTTFSTFSLESMQFMRLKEWVPLILYICASLILGMVCAFLGYSLSESYWS